MTTLTLELSPKVYRRLREQADRLGKTPQVMAEELLDEQLAPPPSAGSTREQVRAALRAGGLLSEVSSAPRTRAGSPVRLADIEASLRRADGAPLSEIVLEQRGPRS